MKGRWEQIAADTRWGRYVSDLEERLILDAAAGFDRPGHLVEIGCETCRWCRMLAARGWRVSGTDVDPDAIATCRKRLPDGDFRLVGAADDTLPLADGTADLALCIEVGPVINASWFAGEAARILRPGGVLVGVAWNIASWRGLAVAAREAIARRERIFYRHSWVSQRRRLIRRGFRFDTEWGFCWLPFGRESNSRLVPALTRLETIGLRHLPAVSPWIGFVATLEGTG